MTDNTHYERAELLRKIYDIADYYGTGAQIDQTLEELAELTIALHHFKKKAKDPICREEIRKNVLEEMADVYIMVNQLLYLMDKEGEMWKWIEYKINRQLERIKGDLK